MRKLKIVSDSSSDLLKLDNADFDFSPMKILTDEREFVDDRNLDVNEMATYLENYKGKSRTSCPNPSDWLEAFGDADDIICVTITSALSGSYNSACVAKQIYESENEGKRVFCARYTFCRSGNHIDLKKIRGVFEKRYGL